MLPFARMRTKDNSPRGGATENLPDVLVRLGEVLPFGAAHQALQAAWVGQTPCSAPPVEPRQLRARREPARCQLFRWE